MVTNIDKKEKYIPLIDNSITIKICFNYEDFYIGDNNESTFGSWYEHVFFNRPSFSQIKQFILDTLNKDTDNRILRGFVWNNMQVWLSSENQFNYKAAYDLAIQTNGANLPTVFKFGSTNNPIYYKFDTVEELTDFYTKAVKYINEQLAIGWARKDAINWDDYKLK